MSRRGFERSCRGNRPEGDSRFLDGVGRCIELRCKIFGMLSRQDEAARSDEPMVLVIRGPAEPAVPIHMLPPASPNGST
jgi:hypothetical protein